VFWKEKKKRKEKMSFLAFGWNEKCKEKPTKDECIKSMFPDGIGALILEYDNDEDWLKKQFGFLNENRDKQKHDENCYSLWCRSDMSPDRDNTSITDAFTDVNKIDEFLHDRKCDRSSLLGKCKWQNKKDEFDWIKCLLESADQLPVITTKVIHMFLFRQSSLKSICFKDSSIQYLTLIRFKLDQKCALLLNKISKLTALDLNSCELDSNFLFTIRWPPIVTWCNSKIKNSEMQVDDLEAQASLTTERFEKSIQMSGVIFFKFDNSEYARNYLLVEVPDAIWIAMHSPSPNHKKNSSYIPIRAPNAKTIYVSSETEEGTNSSWNLDAAFPSGERLVFYLVNSVINVSSQRIWKSIEYFTHWEWKWIQSNTNIKTVEGIRIFYDTTMFEDGRNFYNANFPKNTTIIVPDIMISYAWANSQPKAIFTNIKFQPLKKDHCWLCSSPTLTKLCG
jgi:hypothetical protein